jgi:hypothetical protein
MRSKLPLYLIATRVVLDPGGTIDRTDRVIDLNDRTITLLCRLLTRRSHAKLRPIPQKPARPRDDISWTTTVSHIETTHYDHIDYALIEEVKVPVFI